jgi:riboflavin synthase
MFTGLIEATGKLVARTARGPGARLVISAPLAQLQLGESISVDGVCLTVDSIAKDGFEADASAETLAKTTLGALSIGSRLNLERALRLDARLGGHIVSGHVDGVGALVSREPLGDVAPEGAVNLEIDLLARYVLRLMQAPAPSQERDASLLELLRKNGYV